MTKFKSLAPHLQLAMMGLLSNVGILAFTVVSTVLHIGYLPTLETLKNAKVTCSPRTQPNKPTELKMAILIPDDRGDQDAPA